MKTVACFGEALIDFQPILPIDPHRPARYQQHAGGAPANVAVAVACLGGRAEFIGMLGADPFGDFLQASLRDAGVGTEHVQRTSAAPTALAFVSLDEHGERSFSFYRSPAADLLFRESKLAASAFDSAAVFHACSNSLTEEGIAQTTLACMRRARNTGTLVSFDMNLRPALWPSATDPAPRIRAALALADVVKLSVEELAFLARQTGSESKAMDDLWNSHAALVVVTDGSRPLRWFTPQSSGVLQTYVVNAVDSTAAGDAFTGGLLYSLAQNGIGRSQLAGWIADRDDFHESLRFAAACGALAVTRRGAFSAMPSLAEVEALMRPQVAAKCAATAP